MWYLSHQSTHFPFVVFDVRKLQQWAVSWFKFSGCSPVSLPLSSPPSFARMLGHRLCWGGDRIHIAEFQAPGFLSRGAQSSLSRLSSIFWLSWFSCACLGRSESIRLLWAAWAVAYPALLFPLSVFQPFSKSPIPSQTLFCSHHCKFTLKRFLCLFFTIVLAETLKGKGIHIKVQSAIFLWNPIGDQTS